MSDALAGLALLRKPFPPHQISKLPKPTKRDAPKGRCNECGGWHGLPAVHLDYVGHAALTDRLLEADPAWTWEPLAMNPDGLPVIDPMGGMWIKLTVCGVTRLGYGHAGDKQGGDAIKEVIGDALRNAGMRFGAALDLWHKGDLHADEEDQGNASGNTKKEPKQAERTVLMKFVQNLQDHIANERDLGVLQVYDEAWDRSEEFAGSVWNSLTTPQREYITRLQNQRHTKKEPA